MSEVVVIKTQRQPTRVVVTQSFDVSIKTIRVEMIITPTMDVVRRGIIIGSTTKLCSGSGGVLERRKLSLSSTLLIATIRVVGTPQMVFTNLIMIIHVTRTAD
jgi:hypothetical protein